MPKQDKKFINPLLRPSETPSQPATETSTEASPPMFTPTETSTEGHTLPTTQTPTQAVTYTYTDLPSAQVVRRKRGSQAFEKTHERFTSWMDKRLKAAFEQLADDEETSKTVLLNEAIADLLKKHGK